jgi:hypothetical protein
MDTIEQMKQDARSNNKFLTNEFLSDKTPEELLCWIHPRYRAEYRKELEKQGLITETPKKSMP